MRTIKFLVVAMLALMFIASGCANNSKSGNFTINIVRDFKEAPKSARLWLPYPVSNDFQKIENVVIEANTRNYSVKQDPGNKMHYLYAQWEDKPRYINLQMSFDVKVRKNRIKGLKETNQPIPQEIKKYLVSTPWIPTYGKIAKVAKEATAGKKGILVKARAIYDWVVENTYRDPDTVGCGLGDPLAFVEKPGGKCADISSLYVALARAAGVPAREVFGLRVGKKTKNMTKGYHCWAEFYLPGVGWVPVDPADVRKMMLVKKLNLEQAKKYREYYFGAKDENRIVLAKDARGITFSPKQSQGPLSYFMYPYAEVDGQALDSFDPTHFKYEVWYENES